MRIRLRWWTISGTREGTDLIGGVRSITCGAGAARDTETLSFPRTGPRSSAREFDVGLRARRFFYCYRAALPVFGSHSNVAGSTIFDFVPAFPDWSAIRIRAPLDLEPSAAHVGARFETAPMKERYGARWGNSSSRKNLNGFSGLTKRRRISLLVAVKCPRSNVMYETSKPVRMPCASSNR